ncbi:MAG: hypothetical protein IJB31_01375 [Akkermansia sp.]|nr:hypothetical protein [Akkermansia sp.]
MNIKTQIGKMYAVTSGGACSVTLGNGTVLCSVTNGGQAYFVAPEKEVTISDPEAIVTQCEDFSVAPVAAQGGGGASVTVDAEYNATSANPQAGTAVAQALGTLSVQWDSTKGSIRMGTAKGTPVANGTIEIGTTGNTNSKNSIAIGGGECACREGTYAVALGYGAKGVMQNSIAIGYNARADSNSVSIGAGCYNQIKYGTAVGANAKTGASACTALGYAASVADAGVTCISAWNSEARSIQTQLYLIGCESSLASTYEQGAPCLGYIVKSAQGDILECGTRKLSELLTNNTAFAPAALDLDAPAPTPFLPTGIMEPIVQDIDEPAINQA